MKGKTGEIIPGAYADIIALHADPTKDIKSLQNIKWVMKNGVVYKDLK
jgi:imidazolonepropionase-like amidohydrolase